ncbi:hypothetical protein ACFL4L_07395, partial [bacterium]
QSCACVLYGYFTGSSPPVRLYTLHVSHNIGLVMSRKVPFRRKQARLRRTMPSFQRANNSSGVDTGGARFIDRYAEQIWLTLFAKAPEITLFDYRQMMVPIRPELKAEWQGSGTSYDFDSMIKSEKNEDGTFSEKATMALAAGYTLEVADQVVGLLGNPIGIKSYKPYHSTGEDFLHNYLGMVGIPMDLVPEFPHDSEIILLAETAKHDPAIIQKIKKQLVDGKRVVMTSGLLRALQGQGIEDIVELEYTNRKALVKDFKAGWGQAVQSKEEMIIPQIQYLTNDSWEEISCLDGLNGWPILHSADYANGKLYVLTIPENFSDLYNMPPEVWKKIKQTFMTDIFVRVDGPTQVGLFVYDNNTFIVESFLSENADVDVVIDSKFSKLTDLLTGEDLEGEVLESRMIWGIKIGEDKVQFKTEIKPHSFRVFRCE